jgi:hypothetical protein
VQQQPSRPHCQSKEAPSHHTQAQDVERYGANVTPAQNNLSSIKFSQNENTSIHTHHLRICLILTIVKKK